MINWFLFFIVFDAIMMTIAYLKDNNNGVLFFGFLLIATILLWMKK